MPKRFVYLSENFYDHPQIEGLSDAAFRAYVDGLCRSGFDSFVPTCKPSVVTELIEATLWKPFLDGTYLALGEDDLWRIGAIVGARPAIPTSIRRAVLTRDGHRCVTCGARDDLTLDHIHPYSLGGPDTEENLRTLCRPCNSRKGARI